MSYATGDVTAVAAEDEEDIGGLVGRVRQDSEVHNCFATGEVYAPDHDRVGGLVGYARGDGIYDSYATGDVTGDEKVGGLIGEYHSGDAERCYSAGRVTGSEDVGALVGDDDGIEDSYWDTTVNDGIEFDVDAGEGLTTGEFANSENFPEWDFVDSADAGDRDDPWYMPDSDELADLTGDTNNPRPRLWFELLDE